MSDTPKFEVIDRRKRKLEEEAQAVSTAGPASAPEPESQPELKSEPEPAPGPRLVTSTPAAEPETASQAEQEADPPLPPAPTAEESREQKSAYEASAERLEDLIRAQNPGVGAQPPVTFEHLVQQLYLSAMIQMGAGAREGERPRVDILGARQTIDLLGIVSEKTRGNLSEHESRILDTVLFEARMAFLELTNMITLAPPPPPPAAK